MVKTRVCKMGSAFPYPSISRSVGLFVGTSSLVLMTQCSSTSSSSGQNISPSVSQVVGASGGTVTSGDGALAVAIPVGALTSNITITIVSETSPAAGNLGTVYEIGPTGTQFSSPVTMTFHYGSVDTGGKPESSLRVGTIANGSWQPLANPSEDTTAKTVSGTTLHLSPYGLLATTAYCFDASAGLTCSGGSSGGSSSGGGLGSGSSSCTAPTCAGSNVCAQYPGATVTCTDGPNGYSASCCFPEGKQVCEVFGEGCGGGGGSSGSCGIPTCGANACDSFTTGATQQSCTNTSPMGGTGIEVTCCWSSGAAVPSSSSSSSDGGSSGGGGSSSGGGSGSGGGGSSGSGGASQDGGG